MFFTSCIGNTPMVALEDNLFAKLESFNLTGSSKDRAAQAMILAAEKEKKLAPGGAILAATSGNMGVSLAAIAAGRGYACRIFMPDSMSAERYHLMKAYGAEIVLTPGMTGMSGAVAAAEAQLHEIPNAYLVDQFADPANVMAHYCTTGPELWQQTHGRVCVFVAGVGTGGTVTGVGRYLKEQDRQIHIVAVEPANSPLLSQGWTGCHKIAGIGANFIPKLLDFSVVDAVQTVGDEEAVCAARTLASEKGILAGISSGAVYHVARKLACRHSAETVVALFPDSGSRYLSTGLFSHAE